MEERNDNKNKKIEIVKGDPKKLHISDVKDNLLFEVKEDTKKKNIIIPENQKSNKDNNTDNN